MLEETNLFQQLIESTPRIMPIKRVPIHRLIVAATETVRDTYYLIFRSLYRLKVPLSASDPNLLLRIYHDLELRNLQRSITKKIRLFL